MSSLSAVWNQWNGTVEWNSGIVEWNTGITLRCLLIASIILAGRAQNAKLNGANVKIISERHPTCRMEKRKFKIAKINTSQMQVPQKR